MSGIVYAQDAFDVGSPDAEPELLQVQPLRPSQVQQGTASEMAQAAFAESHEPPSKRTQLQETYQPQAQVLIEEKPVEQPPVQSAEQPPTQPVEQAEQQTSPPTDIARASKTVPIQATIQNVQIEKGPEQKTPPLPTCHAETDVSVWVFGGTKEQGQLLCFNAANHELQYSPVFMTKVFAHSGGFDPNAGLYDQVFLYDMTRMNKKNGQRMKPKRRLFDYEEMEFQLLNFLPWCKQAIDIAPGKEYVVFVKTPATNYWFDLASRTINTGTTLGSLFAGYFIAK